MSTHGRLVIVSGPSGAGKTTVVQRVFQRSSIPLATAVTATTRPPREGERDGVDYHFLAPDEFARRRRNGEFIETCEVFGKGVWYGTPRSEVESKLKTGSWVLLNIDVDGAREVMSRYPDAISIFISPGDEAELERRLRQRGTDDEESIRRRLHRARYEMQQAIHYRHIVINDQVERAADEIARILSQYQEA